VKAYYVMKSFVMHTLAAKLNLQPTTKRLKSKLNPR
jgi:hypothetical protein